MATAAGRPVRGALIARAYGPRPQEIVFQYDPEYVRRHVTRSANGGPPRDVIELTLEFDALDDDPVSPVPTPAAVARVIDLLVGLPGDDASVSLQLGRRTTAVRVCEVSVVEERFDTDMRPVRAVVDLVLEVEPRRPTESALGGSE